MTDALTYSPAEDRYEKVPYRRCGRSGLLLPAVALGGWHNFEDPEFVRRLLRRAFDLGVTHFDLANNYGANTGQPGIAEEHTGRVLAGDLKPYRDEIVVATKAGYRMQPGPYGDGGSRKYLLASLDASLRRLGLDYVDIFYHHRPDRDTPPEETMAALDAAVRQGKALYAAVSNYDAEQTRQAAALMRQLGTPLIANQSKYSMLTRRVEGGTLDACGECGLGLVSFSPLDQGLLTDKYLQDIPADSRAGKPSGTLKPERVTSELRQKLRDLSDIAAGRGQTLAELALTWVLRDERVATVVVGVSRVEQLEQNVQAARDAKPLEAEERHRITAILES